MVPRRSILNDNHPEKLDDKNREHSNGINFLLLVKLTYVKPRPFHCQWLGQLLATGVQYIDTMVITPNYIGLRSKGFLRETQCNKYYSLFIDPMTPLAIETVLFQDIKINIDSNGIMERFTKDHEQHYPMQSVSRIVPSSKINLFSTQNTVDSNRKKPTVNVDFIYDENKLIRNNELL